MRVLFLSQIVPYPPNGGVLQRGYHVIRELGRRASVHMLAFVHPDVLPTQAAIDESRAVLERSCQTVEYFPLWAKASLLHKGAALAASAVSEEPFSMIAHRSAAFGRRVAEALRTSPFDLVHVDTIALSQFVPQDRALPAVLTHHNVESKLMERRAQVERRPLARRFLQRETAKLAAAESRLAPRFDVNIMMSAHDAQTLRDQVPGVRTAVVPNGVDTDYFAPRPEAETPALIYAGGMNMFANRDAVLYFLDEIWPLIRAAHPDVRFFAVGQDPPKDLHARAARDPRVVVTGYVTDVRPLIHHAAVYVVPLRVGGGTRLKVLDAMASGKAIVSTSIGCEGIEVRPGEHIAIGDTPEAFARETVQLLRDGDARRALGCAARRLAEERYSWRIVGDQLLAAYEAATAGRVPR